MWELLEAEEKNNENTPGKIEANTTKCITFWVLDHGQLLRYLWEFSTKPLGNLRVPPPDEMYHFGITQFGITYPLVFLFPEFRCDYLPFYWDGNKHPSIYVGFVR